MNSHLSWFQPCKQATSSSFVSVQLVYRNKWFFKRYLTWPVTHPSLWPPHPAPPPTQPPMSLESPQIQKSLNSFWQSLGPVSRGASSTDFARRWKDLLHWKKIRRRHSVTRLLPEREQSWEHWRLWAGRWPLENRGWMRKCSQRRGEMEYSQPVLRAGANRCSGKKTQNS